MLPINAVVAKTHNAERSPAERPTPTQTMLFPNPCPLTTKGHPTSLSFL
jgi:hypothetical protein